jgi:hypothetical protein
VVALASTSVGEAVHGAKNIRYWVRRRPRTSAQ